MPPDTWHATAEEADLNYDRRRARRVPERQSARVAAKPRKTYQDEGSLHMEDDEEASTSFNMSGEPGFAADGHGAFTEMRGFGVWGGVSRTGAGGCRGGRSVSASVGTLCGLV